MLSLETQPNMAEEETDSLQTGWHAEYQWLASTDHCMDAIVELCPEVVLDRHPAVTSIDSGLAWLTDQQRLAKWECRSGVAYSPRLSGTKELFFQRDGRDGPGYDEWYVFEGPPTDLGEIIEGNPFLPELAPRPGRLMVFVNTSAFALHPELLADMFWKQMEWIKPESYIGDGGECLTFVSRNQRIFETVLQRLRSADEED
jgi:hypothetical protein